MRDVLTFGVWALRDSGGFLRHVLADAFFVGQPRAKDMESLWANATRPHSGNVKYLCEGEKTHDIRTKRPNAGRILFIFQGGQAPIPEIGARARCMGAWGKWVEVLVFCTHIALCWRKTRIPGIGGFQKGDKTHAQQLSEPWPCKRRGEWRGVS